MVCHPDCRARCRHRVYLQVLPRSPVFCRPLFKGGFGPPGTLARLPSLSRLFFLRGRVLGRPRGGRWTGARAVRGPSMPRLCGARRPAAASVPLRALFRPPANSTHLPPVSLFQAQLPL